MNIAQIKSAVTTAESAAAAILQHSSDGQSPFAGPLRSALGRAAELAAEHEKWLAAAVPAVANVAEVAAKVIEVAQATAKPSAPAKTPASGK